MQIRCHGWQSSLWVSTFDSSKKHYIMLPQYSSLSPSLASHHKQYQVQPWVLMQSRKHNWLKSCFFFLGSLLKIYSLRDNSPCIDEPNVSKCATWLFQSYPNKQQQCHLGRMLKLNWLECPTFHFGNISLFKSNQILPLCWHYNTFGHLTT